MNDSKILDILKYNQGFDNPKDWIEYAKRHGFGKVRAHKRLKCPECNRTNSRTIGQYIYYSQLMRIKKCRNCKFIFSDFVLDKDIIMNHFEIAYKNQRYFDVLRKPVFNHIVDTVLRRFPNKRSVIDVGGARGHLAFMLKRRNSKYEITVSDISKKACEYAISHFGINSICCSVEELYKQNLSFDIILLIDVIYYSEDIKGAWDSISRCINDDGVLIMRLPNKIWWVELFQIIKGMFRKNRRADKITGINPEHIYFLNRSYLRNKMANLGFRDMEFCPSPLTYSRNPFKILFSKLIYIISLIIYYLTLKRVCISPAQLLLAWRPKRMH